MGFSRSPSKSFLCFVRHLIYPQTRTAASCTGGDVATAHRGGGRRVAGHRRRGSGAPQVSSAPPRRESSHHYPFFSLYFHLGHIQRVASGAFPQAPVKQGRLPVEAHQAPGVLPRRQPSMLPRFPAQPRRLRALAGALLRTRQPP